MHCIACIHQPPFLPWLGIVESMLVCDIFVAYDDVQYKKHDYQNRNKILAHQEAMWLTIPVKSKGRFGQKVNEVEVAENYRPRKWLTLLKQNYGQAPYFGTYFPEIAKILSHPPVRLIDLNMQLLEYLKTCIKAKCEFKLSSQIGLTEYGRSERLAEICKVLGCKVYYSGSGTKEYVDQAEFVKRGITIVWHDYQTRHVVYPQINTKGDFVPCLSWIDMMFNCGAEQMRSELLHSGRAKLAEYGLTC